MEVKARGTYEKGKNMADRPHADRRNFSNLSTRLYFGRSNVNYLPVNIFSKETVTN
jgi:hypothetical protein